jgi:glycine reductase
MTKIIYYVNQFFGGIGGEDKADAALEIRDEMTGPSLAFSSEWGEDCHISHTIVCGDNYFNENQETVIQQIVDLVKSQNPSLFVAGPAFNAGRYGVACVTICKQVRDLCGVHVLTGMFDENPGVASADRSLYIVSTGNTAASMRKAIPAMVKLAKKIVRNEKILSAADDGYIPRGVRKNEIANEIAAVRALQMLHKKLSGAAYTTEVKVETYEKIPAANPIKDLSTATIAVVTEAGVVPIGNPDRIKHASADSWSSYQIDGIEDLTEGAYESVHGGYDASYCNRDPDRVVPIDALRFFESTGYIGKLHNTVYVTVGNGTPIERCKKFGAAIAQKLLEAKVDGVLLPSS